MRENQAIEQLFGGAGGADASKARKNARDDSAAKNILQMKSVPLSVFV